MARRKNPPKLDHIADGLRKLATPISDLSPDPGNVRTHDDRNIGAIADSLREFGQRKPIVVRASDNVVTAGNGTLEAARRLGWETIAAVFVDDDVQTSQRYAIADNRTAELAEWDDEGLAKLLGELQEADALEGVGFDGGELAALLASLDPSTSGGGFPQLSGAGIRAKRGIPKPDGTWTVVEGDAAVVCRGLGPFDAVLCDPPYGLSFMGKDWDHQVPGPELWRAVLGELRPGAHLVAFGGTRLYHRLACAIEDAGAEIRDCMMWLYGSGFPKSHDVSKALDKEAGATREVVGHKTAGIANPNDSDRHTVGGSSSVVVDITAPATEEAKHFEGYGTALKPAWEPAIVARKPLAGTVAANALEHGTGGLNIDGGRIGTEVRVNPPGSTGPRLAMNDGWRNDAQPTETEGRWPANVALDEEAARMLDEQSGESTSSGGLTPGVGAGDGRVYSMPGNRLGANAGGLGDTGGASRFFYVAKASRAEREAGLGSPTSVAEGVGALRDGGRGSARANVHPTVKPVDLCRWLATLLLPPPLDRPRRILVPFSGSGSEMIGALLAGWDEVVGIELNPEYATIARARLESWRDDLPSEEDE